MNNFDDIYANNVSSQKIPSTHYNSFYFDALNGLSKKNKKIPYKYLYDKNGVRLFNDIIIPFSSHLLKWSLKAKREFLS